MKGDTFRHQGLRRRLVEIIRKQGIKDERVLEAIGKVPRHLFIGETAFDEKAYANEAFPIGEGQTISQPYTVAFQTELLNIEPGHKVLEIGTGSGYQAAILAEMGAQVYTIERNRNLYKRTKKLLEELGYKRIKCFYGDGWEGLPAFAPFDRIIITAAAPEIPEKLLEQLKPGGIMVVPLGKSVQTMTRIIKKEDGSIEKEQFMKFRFVPMLRGKE